MKEKVTANPNISVFNQLDSKRIGKTQRFDFTFVNLNVMGLQSEIAS